MESLLRLMADHVAMGCELIAVLLLAFAALETLAILARGALTRDMACKRRAWRIFAAWIILALELTLAADIVRTAIAPTWNDIGQLAAIAMIRTVLNLFLERDLEAFVRAKREQPPPA